MLLIAPFLLTACATTLPEVSRQPSYAIVAGASSPIASAVAGVLAKHPGQTGVQALGDGQESFFARISAIDAAEVSVDLQYYIYRSDTAGRLLVWSLINAADRGVRVRILLDDMESRSDGAMLRLNTHHNIQIRLFNPFVNRHRRRAELLTSLGRLNHRMHNKSLVIDGRLAIVGGRNIGDEYFAHHKKTNFRDFDLLTIGPALDGISRQFDLYWNSVLAIPIDAFVNADDSAERFYDDRQKLDASVRKILSSESADGPPRASITDRLSGNNVEWYWGAARVLYDKPEKAIAGAVQLETYLAIQLKEYLDAAQAHALIISPYFVPGKVGAQVLLDMAARGVDLTIITNSLASTDVVAVHSGYRKYRKPLLRGGVKLYEVKVDLDNRPDTWKASSKASLHAKTFVIDQRFVFVGSFNFDPRSISINTEMGLMIDAPGLARFITDRINSSLDDNSYRVVLNDKGKLRWHDVANGRVLKGEPDASLWRHLGVFFTSLIPIEDQL